MKISYWSDFACPYCYIGNERLKKAIKDLLDYKKIPYRMIQEEVIDGLVKSIRFLINEASEEKLGIYYDWL